MRKIGYIVLPGIFLLGWWLNGKFDATTASPQQRLTALAKKEASDPLQISTAQRDESDFSREFELNFGLKASFDQFIFQHELLSITQMIDAYGKFIKPENYSPRSNQYAIDLFSRYVSYKASLVEIDDVEMTNSIQTIAERLEARNDLRFQFFNEREHHYLFAKDAAFDNAALERLRIASDMSLDQTDKRRLIEQQLATLPKDQRASFAPSLAVNRLNQLQQNYASKEVRFQAVAAEFGNEVAQRVSEQEQQQQSWIEKVKAYQQWQAQLENDATLTKEALNAHIKQKQKAMFSERERRRLVVYLENPALLVEK